MVATDTKKEGRYGYAILVACCALLIPVSLCISCIGLFYTPMADEFGVGKGLMSNFHTCVWAVSIVALPIWGRIINKVDIRIIDTIAVLAIGGGLIICSFATTPVVAIASGALCGVGVSILLLLHAAVMINRWFRKRAGFFISVVMLFTAVGAVFFSPILGNLIAEFGWHTALRIDAVVGLVIGLPFAIFVMRSYPADKNQLAIGAEETDDEAAGSAKEELPGLTASKAYRTPTFIIFVVFVLVMDLIYYAQAMNPNYINALPISEYMPQLFSTIASFLMVGQAVAKLSIGGIGEKHPLATGIAVIVLGMLGFGGNLVLTDNAVGLIISGALIGAFLALANVLCPIITKRYFGLKDYSKIYSVVAMVMAVSSVLQGPILGSVLDATGWVTLHHVYLALSAVSIVLLVVTVFFGEKMIKDNGGYDQA